MTFKPCSPQPLPTVAAIMLTRDRPEMARRAIECFRRQTYPGVKRLLFVLDTGADPELSADLRGSFPEYYRHDPTLARKTIGALRNLAIQYTEAQIVMHWDDDDWSSPDRMTEQVALLNSSGSDVVGYNAMLFYRAAGVGRNVSGHSRDCNICQSIPCSCSAQVWIYRGSVLGTSLCYRRSLWSHNKFRDTSRGEDASFVSGARVTTSSSLMFDPMMIATLHGGNSSSQIYPGASEWQRADQHVARVEGLLADGRGCSICGSAHESYDPCIPRQASSIIPSVGKCLICGNIPCIHGKPAADPSEDCEDCEAAQRHSYSDATTAGFFKSKCSKHSQGKTG